MFRSLRVFSDAGFEISLEMNLVLDIPDIFEFPTANP